MPKSCVVPMLYLYQLELCQLVLHAYLQVAFNLETHGCGPTHKMNPRATQAKHQGLCPLVESASRCRKEAPIAVSMQA